MPYPRDTILAGKLRVVRLLGEGGLGEVYEVEHQLTRHRRALKVLKPQWRSDKELVERFLREASAAGHIGNPHIVETFDAGTLEDGSPYLLMEILEGQSLDQVLRWNGRLDAGVAVQLVLQVCDAIGAAHRAGIVHRDLKPENLFLLKRDGHSFIKVLDFGISKFDVGLTGHVKVTNTNTALGTPLYMSPEQMRASREVDQRADIYSLAVILYECIAGTPPFVAESFAELAAMALRGEAKPLNEVMPAVPKELARVISRGMAPDRNHRFSSVEAMAEALEPFAMPGVTSLTEIPQKERVPVQRFLQRQPTVSPWGPTDRPDEETHSGVHSGVEARPTEEAPALRPKGDTTEVTRRWPLLLLGGAIVLGGVLFWVRAASVQTPPPESAGGTATAPTIVAVTGGGAPAPIQPDVEPPAIPPTLGRVPPVAGGSVSDTQVASPTEAAGSADSGLPVVSSIKPVRPSSSSRSAPDAPLARVDRGRKEGVTEPITGELHVICPNVTDGCVGFKPAVIRDIEAPLIGHNAPSGEVVVKTKSGKMSNSYRIQFSKPGQVVKLEARPSNGGIVLGLKQD